MSRVIWITIWQRLRRGIEGGPAQTFTSLNYPMAYVMLWRWGSFPTSVLGAGTFQPTAESAARDGFGQKNQSPTLFRTTEHLSPAACVPHVPSGAPTDTCAAATPLTGEMPEQNGLWKAPREWPVHRGGSFRRDDLQYSRRRGVSRLATTHHGWVPAPWPSANHLKY